MTRAARRPYEWLTLGAGLVAASIWASLGLRAVVMDSEPSVNALLACAALVLVGVALGSVTWTVTAPKRAKRPPADAIVREEMSAPFAMLGIMLIGSGASPIVDPSTSTWAWALMVAASLVGGLNLGVAFMGIADQAAASNAPRQATGAPRSGG